MEISQIRSKISSNKFINNGIYTILLVHKFDAVDMITRLVFEGKTAVFRAKTKSQFLGGL